MKLSVSELREVVRILMDHIQAAEPAEVEIEQDFYWSVSSPQLYDPYTKPTDLTLGQLSDDWSELQKLLAEKRAPNRIDLVWLSNILRRLGEQPHTKR